MEPQLQHTQGHHYEEQEDEHHGEKKSMMQKVKEKAKRFKDSMTKHGHQQHDDGDDDDNEDETVEDPKVHDSANASTQPSGNLERPSVIAKDPYTNKPVASHGPLPTFPARADGTNLSGQSGLGGQQHQGFGQEVNPEEKKEVPFAPNPATVPTPETEHTYGTKHPSENRGQDGTHGGSESSIGKSTGMMKVPHDPSGLGSGLGSGSDPANYETKVTNPTHTDAILTQPSDNLERPSVIAEERYTKPMASHDPPLTVPAGADGTHLSGQSGQQHQVYGQEVNPEEEEEVPFAPNPATVPTPETEDTYGTKHQFENHGQDGTHGGSESSIGKSTGMMKVPHSPSGLGSGSGSDPANYETKDTNPTDTDAILTQPSDNLERPSVITEDCYAKPVASHDPPLTVPAGADGTNLSGQSELGGQQHQVYGQEDINPEKWRSEIGEPTGMEEEVPFAPNPATVPTPVTEHTYGTEHPYENHGQDGTHGGLKSSIGKSTGMMKVPHAPSGLGSGSGSGSDPANYETKVTNPTDTVYDSDAILTQPSDNLERPSMIAEDCYTKPVASHDPPLTVPAGADGTNLSGQSGLGGQQHQVYGQEDINPEKWRSEIGEPTEMEEEVPFAPNPATVPTPETEHTYGTEHPFENHGQDGTHGVLQSSIGKSTGMMKVPHAPSGVGSGSGSGPGSDPANYETKVTNPTHAGGKEAGLSQMQHSFDKMGIHDSGSERKRFDPEHPESIRRATLAGNQSTQSSSYTEKISSTASAPAEKAAVAKDVIASKLGYSGEHPTTAESHENVKNSGSTATDYAHMITDKVTETLAPVYEKMVDAGSSVMSKVQGTVFGTGTGSGAGTGHQQMHGTENVKATDKVVSVKEGDEDKAHAIHGGNQEESDKNVTERTE